MSYYKWVAPIRNTLTLHIMQQLQKSVGKNIPAQFWLDFCLHYKWTRFYRSEINLKQLQEMSSSLDGLNSFSNVHNNLDLF